MAKVYLWQSVQGIHGNEKIVAQVALKQEYVGMVQQERQFSYSGTEKKEFILL